MKIEEAIRTALVYEHKVRDHFRQSAEKTADARAKQFFEVMAGEEQDHIAYLEHRLAQWQKEGTVEPETLASAVPDRAWLEEGVQTLEAGEPSRPQPAVREYLNTALRMEYEVTEFYRRLVETVDHPGALEMFRRFLEIEGGHTTLVQAEIDHETKTGHFFDFREFTLDG